MNENDSRIALAQELRDAAAKVRKAAASAMSDNWYSAEALAQSLCSEDVEWIALMGPVLAEPLAAWLDGAAENWRWVSSVVDADTHPAILTARAINGGAR